LRRFSSLGIQVRRQGNEIILQRPTEPGGFKGPTFPIPSDRKLRTHYVNHACRVFGLDPKQFWNTRATPARAAQNTAAVFLGDLGKACREPGSPGPGDHARGGGRDS